VVKDAEFGMARKGGRAMTTFRRIVLYSAPYWRRIVISTVASALVGGMDGALAYLLEPLLRKIFTNHDMSIFALLPIGAVALFSLRAASRFANDYFIRTAGELAVRDIRKDLYRTMLDLDLRFYGKHPTGGLMSRVVSDVGVMQNGIASVVPGLCRETISAASLLGVVFYLNWQLALTTFVVIPLTLLAAKKFGRRIKKLSAEGLQKVGEYVSILQETLSGIKVIKAFHLEAAKAGMFHEVTRQYYGFVRKSIFYSALSKPVIETITSIGIAMVIWSGGGMVMRGEMTASEFFSFMAAMAFVYKPVRNLNDLYNTIQNSLGAAERVFEIIDRQPGIVDAPDAVQIEACRGQVKFRGVAFAYGAGPVLAEININAQPGEVIALVGPSGGGKTTLVSLIPRFYDVSAGAVLIDGIDVRRLSRRSLIAQIALVDQEITLFNDTIANNIRYGNFSATDLEVETAARAAYAHDFIDTMADGYQTMIGDRGVRLSGGQRQRICIARALLKNAPILILDEATSSLDTESEQMVQRALNNLMRSRTTFVVAHRLSTVFHADQIVVIDQGRIVESGRHEELLARGGLYRQLYGMQSK